MILCKDKLKILLISQYLNVIKYFDNKYNICKSKQTDRQNIFKKIEIYLRVFAGDLSPVTIPHVFSVQFTFPLQTHNLLHPPEVFFFFFLEISHVSPGTVTKSLTNFIT